MAYSKGSLVLSEATMDDLPELARLFPQSFHSDPYYKHMFPDTPANEKWWQEAHRISLQDPRTRLIKVTDQSSGRIVAEARWMLARDGDDGPQPGAEEGRWPEFTADVDRTLSDPFFAKMEECRERIMGDQKHIFLELIEVISEYKGKGVGSLMMRYGCDLADKDGLEIYVDSSSEGYPFYLHSGFVLKEEDVMPGDFGFGLRHLIRPARRSN